MPPKPSTPSPSSTQPSSTTSSTTAPSTAAPSLSTAAPATAAAKAKQQLLLLRSLAQKQTVLPSQSAAERPAQLAQPQQEAQPTNLLWSESIQKEGDGKIEVSWEDHMQRPEYRRSNQPKAIKAYTINKESRLDAYWIGCDVY